MSGHRLPGEIATMSGSGRAARTVAITLMRCDRSKMPNHHAALSTGILLAATAVAACMTTPYDYRDFHAPPSIDPFLTDQRVGGGPDGSMTVRGELVVFDSECGTVTVRRLAGS